MINVDKPVSTFTTAIHSVRTGTGPNNIDTVFGLMDESQPGPGIVFTGSVTMPTGWPQGKWNWVQMITSSRKFTNAANGSHTHTGDGNTKKLDKWYPYYPRPFTGLPSLAGSWAADETSHSEASDSPTEPLFGRTRIEINDTFETYLMFKSSEINSRYVPLKMANWKWGGVVSSTDNFTNVTSPIKSADEVGAECTSHPQWSANSNADTEVNDP